MLRAGRAGQILRCGLVILLTCCVALTGSLAEARKPEPMDAKSLLDASAQALLEQRYAAAYEAIVASYRAEPSARALYQLGLLAQAEGRQAAAQDLMRRFLAEVQGTAPEQDPAVAQARRILAEALPLAGEIRLFGARGAQVFADDRLVGTLPLALPLLCAPGTHKIALEYGKRRLLGKVAVRAGHTAEMRFNGETGAVLVTLPPTVLLVLDAPDGAAALRLEQAAVDMLQAESYGVFRTELALALANKPAACLRDLACVSEIAERSGVTYALGLRARAKGPGDAAEWELAATFLDTSVGSVGAESEKSCAPCSTERAATEAAVLLKQILAQGSARPRGTLSLSSTPQGAEIREEGRLLGVTPYQRAAYAGTHKLLIEREGFEPVSITVNLSPGETAVSEPVLKEFPEPAPAPLLLPPAPLPQPPARPALERLPRPRWRLGLGGALVAVGGGLLLLGISAAASAGGCVEPPLVAEGACRRVFQTAPAAAGLLPTGAVLTVGGLLLLALPGPRHPGVR